MASERRNMFHGRRRKSVLLCVERGCVTGYKTESDVRPMFAHPLYLVARHFMNPGDLTSFLYIVRDVVQPLLYIHLFQSIDVDGNRPGLRRSEQRPIDTDEV
ncbi:hypothetical protein AAG570_006476 [Ranatra chinensis]|uniref:Uncharacterized protein n=1 Tax=Ranatra chinensis TaxID=642074 RepID=A0ABD0Z6X1_9HEMI